MMKLFLPLILLLCFNANAQKEDCAQLGESLSIKIDSICFSGWNHSSKPTITIIDYGILPSNRDTVSNTKFSGSAKVYRLNNQILKIEYQRRNDDVDRFRSEFEDIQIYFDQDEPIYVDYKLETNTGEKKIIDLKIIFCMAEVYDLNKSVNLESIIESVNQLIDDARN